MKYRLCFLIIFLFHTQVSNTEAAKLYQCGDNSYQQMPCNEGVKQKTLNPDISKTGVQFSKPQVISKLTPQSNNEHREEQRRVNLINNLKRKYEGAKKLCRANRKALKKLQQGVIDKCKKSRDTFCNGSAQKIADKNYNRAVVRPSRPGWSPTHELNGRFSNQQYCQEAKSIKKKLKDTYDFTVR